MFQPMTWKPLPNNHPIALSYNELSQIDRLIYNKTKNIYIARQRMLFGYRLKAGYLNNILTTELDICCGNLDRYYQELLLNVTTIIDANPPDDPLKGIPPFSIIKPYYNDIDFCNTIEDLLNKVQAPIK